MESFERVLEEHGPALARVVAGYAAPGADRDDLWQDVALAVWRALPRFRGESALRTFLYRIAHNRGVDHLHRRRLRSGAAAGDPGRAVDPDPGPEALASAREERERLAAAIRRLPLGQRQCLMLALEGLPHAEIGDVLGLAENAVAVRLHRARRNLRALLEDGHGR